MIKSLTIVTAQGVKTYEIGQRLNCSTIIEIKKAFIYITGDPFNHYCGYDSKGKMLFSVNCLAPCDIEYLI